MLRRHRTLPRLLAAAFATVLASGLAMTASAQSSPTIANDGTLLSVSAEAKVTRTPDIATLSTGVVTQAAEANAALRQNTEQMTKVVAAIKAAGIAERDVQTSGISINPQYRYAENQPPTITGYQASNTLNVKVRDIAKLGKVLDTLVSVGANQVNGPSFEIDNPDEAYDEARVAAIKKAQSRAELYAKTLGLRVRRVVSINEGGGNAPPSPMPVMMRMQAMDASEPPVSPGESALSTTINVVFELGR
jgi:uncharacterized protein